MTDEADAVDLGPSTETARSAPSDAFQALGNEVRMGILETMHERTRGDGPANATFSELFDAADVDTSAGFAYHLEQLVGSYLRKSEDGYELTYAGSKIARAVATGTYTRRVDRQSVELAEPCPFCADGSIEAQSTDNVVAITCRDCERPLLRLGFPPSGLESHHEEFPRAFDRYHRHRFALARAGVCPECSGAIRSRLVTPPATVTDALPSELAEQVQAAFECGECGLELRCPVTLSLLGHPAIVSFYADHDADVRDRPIWNVGHEWTETVLADEPLAVRVGTELGGEALSLYVDDRVRVVETRRANAAEPNGEAE